NIEEIGYDIRGLRWSITNKIPRLNENKEVNGIIGLSIDITERKLIEQKLKESEEKYRLITENINDILGIVNDKLNLEFVNESTCLKVLGYKPAEVIGKNPLEFIHPDDREESIKTFNKGLIEGYGMIEVRIQHKNGNYLWFDLNGNIFHDNSGKRKGIIVGRDITERKEAEHKLIESEKKYRKAYKKAVFYKDLLTHDMANIISNIKSSVTLCTLNLKQSDRSKEMDEFHEIIQEQLVRVSGLISNIHKLSRLEEVEIFLSLINVQKILSQAIKLMNNNFQTRNIKTQIQSSEDNIYILGNDLLVDVFENLLSNAIRYNENPTVEILIKISKNKKAGKSYVKIEFIDNGIGIPDDLKKNIFQKGYREQKGQKGMGIGLSLVKKIVKSYNGLIKIKNRIKNDYHRGSRFIIIIPEASHKDFED
ncbi:MAG: PAS domain S-box protein, partial [Candidatus Odinarchaeota archaeon]